MKSPDLDVLVRTGFRPANLPPKSPKEKERHLAHVEAIISSVSVSPNSIRIARESEKRALDALWRTELMTGPSLELTEQMKRLWEEYGLPSQLVRSVVWPWSASGFSDSPTVYEPLLTDPGEDTVKLIGIDVRRTLPFLGFHVSAEEESSESLKELKCVEVLKKFSVLHPHIGYTQGMSYVCVRLMMELSFEAAKCLVCLERILIESPTVSCMYRLDLREIKNGAEFVLDSIAWDNVPRLWMLLKSMKFAVVDWFFLEWTLTMFVKNFGIKISGFILDLFFLKGDVVLYKSAIAALSIVEDELLDLEDSESIRGLIGQIGDKTDLENFTKTFHEIVVPAAVFEIIDQGKVFHINNS